MLYKIRILKTASKFLEGQNSKDRFRIYMALELLRENPYPPRVRKIKGSQNSYRVRVGDFRIIYQVIQSQLIVEVIRIGFRRDVYRNL